MCTGRRWSRDDGHRDTQIHLQAKECLLLGKGVREGKVQKKMEAGTLQEQITFNEARRGSSQISELLH